jgi:type 2A phosphatase activator TIP41
MQAPHEKLPNGLRIAGWTITIEKKPILNSAEFDEWSEKLNIPKLPDMLFGNNKFELKHDATGFVYSFNAFDALQQIEEKADINVSYGDEWLKKNSEVMESLKAKQVQHFDWTYTTRYSGTIDTQHVLVPVDKESFGVPHPTQDKLDMNRLRRQDPIILLEEQVLYEDELADNGSSKLEVKIRVMPTFWFVLMRFYLRVDHVVLRIHDVRLFFDYHKPDAILREQQWREVPYNSLATLLASEPKSLLDGNIVASMMPLGKQLADRIPLVPKQD